MRFGIPEGFSKESVATTGISPGEKYYAIRNGDGIILTCARDDVANGWVEPEENDYLYNRSSCFKQLPARRKVCD